MILKIEQANSMLKDCLHYYFEMILGIEYCGYDETGCEVHQQVMRRRKRWRHDTHDCRINLHLPG
jgi:hypothetical protein